MVKWRINIQLWYTNMTPKSDPGSLTAKVAFEGPQDGTKGYSLCSGKNRLNYHNHLKDTKGSFQIYGTSK